MVPYLGQTSARNSSGVEALDTRWMEPAPTGNSACQDPGSPHDSCTRPHQDPSGPGSWLRGREARRSRLSLHTSAPAVLVLLPRTSREGFFGKISLVWLSTSPGHCRSTLTARSCAGPGPGGCFFPTTAPRCSSGFGSGGPNPWWPLSAPHRRMLPPIPGEFSLVCGLQPLLASPHLCFITAFPAAGSLRIGPVSSCFLYCSCIFCSCFCSGSLPEG